MMFIGFANIASAACPKSEEIQALFDEDRDLTEGTELILSSQVWKITEFKGPQPAVKPFAAAPARELASGVCRYNVLHGSLDAATLGGKLVITLVPRPDVDEG